MESEAVLVPCALDLLYCLMQIPSLTAAPSPEGRCGFSLTFQFFSYLSPSSSFSPES